MLGQAGKPGVCPQLEEVIGRVEGERRWTQFLEAGLQTAIEFRQSWETLAGEAWESWQFLGKEPACLPSPAPWVPDRIVVKIRASREF
jgi:hypothetical protein